MNAADSFSTDSTAETTIGSGSSPSRNTAVETYSTTAITPMIATTTTPMATPGSRSCCVFNSPGADTFGYTASSSVDYGPTLTESHSESSSSGQIMPANTYLQGLNAESIGIMNTFTSEETGGLMSSEELYSLLERFEASFDAI
jgi:hypothetical protein